MELVVLFAHIVRSYTRTQRMGRGEDEGKVDVLGLVRAIVFSHLEDLRPTDHLVDGSETESCHDSSKFISDIIEEIDNMLWRSSEFLP